MKKTRFTLGNHLTLLACGAAYFPALIAAIEQARDEIYLETYIFEPDATGRAVAAALSAAALRGVAVRVVVDGFGSGEFIKRLMPQLTKCGVAVLVYRPELSALSLRKRRLRRLHRKLCVVDGRVAFVGGINVIDDFDPPGSGKPRLDYAVRIEGPLLQPIHGHVRRLWEVVAWASFNRRLAVNAPRWEGDSLDGTVRAAFVVRDNIRHRRDIENAYIDALNHAREEVLIANAYFLPGRPFRQALLAAARRGVRVTLLLQGQVEYRVLHYATQSLYGALMRHGVRIVEYNASFLHAKVAVIDQRWSTVGSSNIDPFSLLLAREANVVVKDEGFARQLHAHLSAEITAHGRALDPMSWAQRSLVYRLINRLSYGMLRFLIGLAGFAHEH